MSYPTHDTDWAIARTGNYWRRLRGKVLIVGRRKSGNGYWARRGDDFVEGNFASLSSAKSAAETGIAGADDSSFYDDDDWEDV